VRKCVQVADIVRRGWAYGRQMGAVHYLPISKALIGISPHCRVLSVY
jgi:hypothetical protein